MSSSRRSSADYRPESTAVPAARAHVRQVLYAWDLPFDRVEDAVLVAGELVTNAVVHAGTDIRVTCRHDTGTGQVRIEVRDLLPTRPVEGPAGAVADQDGHHGLVLTHSFAEAWGVTYTKTSKTVWFELDCREAEPARLQAVQAGQGLQYVQPALISAPAVPPPARPAWDAVRDLDTDEIPADRLFDHVVQWARASTGADAAYVLVGDEDETLTVRATALNEDADGTAEAAGSAGDSGSGEGGGGRTSPSGAVRFAFLGSDDGEPDDSPGSAGQDGRETATSAPMLLRPGEAAQLAVATRDHAAVVPPPDGSRFRSLATAPLRIGGKRLGLVVVTAEEAGRFGPADIARLEYAATSLAPVVSRERRAPPRHGYRGWLGFLAEANDLLAGTLDEKLVLALAAQLFVPRIAGWCAVYLDDMGGRPELAHVWHADEQRIVPLREMLAGCSAPAVHQLREARQWSAFAALAPSAREVCGPDALELPLACRDHRFGSIVLGAPGEGPFRPELVRLAEDLGHRFALALHNARRYGEQVAVSQTLQRSLLPAQLPQIPGLDYSILYLPAGQDAKAGGDFYDVFPAGPGRWRFMLGDVCGTGAAAAAVTGLVRHTLRALSREGHSTARALDSLNEAMLDEEASRMLTVVHGELERLPTGNLRVSVTSAGHPLPLRLRPDGEVIPIGTSQLLVGAVSRPAYEIESVELVPGDLMLCVTDGVTERRRGEIQLDDDDGLAALLSECTGLTARAVSLRVQSAVRDFTPAPLADDIAIFALRVENPPG